MPWNPKYTITNKLLSIIRQIGELIGEIKASNPSKSALVKLEYNSRELSAYASTSIEGNPLRLTDVKRLLKTKHGNIRDTEREVLNYNQALQQLNSQIKKNSFLLDISTFEKTQGTLVKKLMPHINQCGQLRKEAVVIRDPRNPNGIVYIPPDAKDVPDLLNKLCDFINGQINEIEPIILAGLLHRQSVIIHPFMDGNGRTIRLLTTAFLGATGLDFFDIFSFENYYNINVTKYFNTVGLFGDYYSLVKEGIDHTIWLEYFTEGVLDELTRVVKNIHKNNAPRIELHLQEILNYIDIHGSITQKEYGKISNRSLASRKADFLRLIKYNLIEKKGNGRGTYYVKKF